MLFVSFVGIRYLCRQSILACWPKKDSDGNMEDAVNEVSPPAKKPRLFIARQACEHCRLKKTRCDEHRPACGHCSAAGIECNYGERKATKYGFDPRCSLLQPDSH
jgi:hypothetical protein